ncbi:tetratricopeptide repeat protein [Paenibacillus thermotolerans]|uniref:tetratricopeptide repeat protein n=1 Tax=Paenibacillus thermotolerans TaxID=3027807 RepID=UPI0023683D5C|nr:MULTISPECIES: hypothetical protein [unclassified Paenibacillus]
MTIDSKGLSLSDAYIPSTAQEATDLLAEHACLACGKIGMYLSGDKGKRRQADAVRYYKVGMKCMCGFINFVYLIMNDIERVRNPRIPAAADALGLASAADALPDGKLELMLTETKVLAYQGKLVEATSKARVSAEQYPDSAAAQFNLGYLLSASGDREGALAHYRHSVECDAGFTAAWYQIGVISEQLERWEEAVQGYNAFLKHHRNHADCIKRKQRCEEELRKERSVS